MTSRRSFIGLGVVAICACAAAPASLAQTPAPPGTKFICPPCGCSADGQVFDKPGVCPADNCGMTLIPKPVEPAKAGGGALMAAGGRKAHGLAPHASARLG